MKKRKITSLEVGGGSKWRIAISMFVGRGDRVE